MRAPGGYELQNDYFILLSAEAIRVAIYTWQAEVRTGRADRDLRGTRDSRVGIDLQIGRIAAARNRCAGGSGAGRGSTVAGGNQRYQQRQEKGCERMAMPAHEHALPALLRC